MTTPSETTTTMIRDGGEGTYECGELTCGYDGDLYCQNCGYARGEGTTETDA